MCWIATLGVYGLEWQLCELSVCERVKSVVRGGQLAARVWDHASLSEPLSLSSRVHTLRVGTMDFRIDRRRPWTAIFRDAVTPARITVSSSVPLTVIRSSFRRISQQPACPPALCAPPPLSRTLFHHVEGRDRARCA